jgi:hypothetical protein
MNSSDKRFECKRPFLRQYIALYLCRFRKSTGGESGPRKPISKQSSTESAPSNRQSRRSSSDTSGATHRRSKQNSGGGGGDYPLAVSPLPYRQRHESSGGGGENHEYQLLPPRGTNRTSAEFLHSPRGGGVAGRTSDDRMQHHRDSIGEQHSPRGYYGDGESRANDYLLAPPSRSGRNGGSGRRSPLPGGHHSDTLPRGGGSGRPPPRPSYSGTLPPANRGGRERLLGGGGDEEDEGEGEEIPLVEYHHHHQQQLQAVAAGSPPRLRVLPPDTWRTNNGGGGGARPKQRYEVRTHHFTQYILRH